ncbi:hypothetical protein LNQ03_09355 [Klebsiella pneumoniae subsp. pneumoniae]|nr:hypothetical protein [Klebsiella pneumoniae subsp. pneumoniae]
MERGIFRVPARRKRKVEVKPSDIPTLKDYTARLVDKKWAPPGRKEATCFKRTQRRCKNLPGQIHPGIRKPSLALP